MGSAVPSTLYKMANITGRQILLLRKFQKHAIKNASRSMASVKPWNYLWKPGPYPQTEEERLAAAKKYGMIPEDYKPYPIDGTWNENGLGTQGLGDYPMLEKSSQDSRSGHVNWDDPDLKRNYGEPPHYNYYMTQEIKYDDTTRFRYTNLQWLGIFLGLLTFFASPYYFLRN